MKKQDILTPIGLLAAVAVLYLGIALDDSGISIFIDLPSVAITIGGSIAAVLITFSIEDIKQIPWAIKVCFTSNNIYKIDLIDQFKELSRKIRKDGVLSIEDDVAQIEDDFLKKALELVIDGMDMESIQVVLDNEINLVETKYENSSRVFKVWSSYAPAMGMVGTLIGLVQMLSGGLDNASVIATGMSKALITTFYGSILANIILSPVGYNVQTKGEKEVEYMDMMVCGITCIQNGDSTRIIEEKLVTYLSNKERRSYYNRESDDKGVDTDVA